MNLSIPTIENLCINTCFGILLTTTVYYWSQLFFGKASSPNKIGRIGSGSAVVFLTVHLILRWIESGHFPLSNLYESLLFLTWCLLILLLYLETVLKTLFLGVLLSPGLLCLIAFTDFSLPPELQKSSPLVPALQSNWLMMHVTVMIASYAALLFGCLLAIAYLLFSTWTKEVKSLDLKKETRNQGTVFSEVSPFTQPDFLAKGQKQSQSFFGSSQRSEFLSPEFANLSKNVVSENWSQGKNSALLEFLDNVSYRTIGIGFCFLTLGILSGAVWANETWGNYWSWDPKETWAFITWLTFATYLHSRLVGGWTGLKPAWIASFGFFIVWICYLGVNLLGQGLHSYGFLQL